MASWFQVHHRLWANSRSRSSLGGRQGTTRNVWLGRIITSEVKLEQVLYCKSGESENRARGEIPGAAQDAEPEKD